ncbi:MAG: imidazole glycerol phosphate synthase subunit HisH, partial [Melioribacteraceae bacterium]|nr:imidazole glycerol phosphate synthase subunit HisH [Melioribacteraceae bacterium]
MNEVIIDYGMGNLHSVKKKLQRIGVNAEISNNPSEIIGASKLFLPGVGHFTRAIQNLKALHLYEALNEAVLVKKTPILGICLGLQLMAKHSEEGSVEGFGWFDAEVVHFDIQDQLKHKVPHMGWNSVKTLKQSTIFDGIPKNQEFYFVHSYHIKSNKEEDVLATTDYEYNFVSAL